MATPADLFEIFTLAFCELAQNPNLQPSQLDDLQELASDPEAFAEELGLQLNGVSLDDEDTRSTGSGENGEISELTDGDVPSEPMRKSLNRETLREYLQRLRQRLKQMNTN